MTLTITDKHYESKKESRQGRPIARRGWATTQAPNILGALFFVYGQLMLIIWEMLTSAPGALFKHLK